MIDLGQFLKLGRGEARTGGRDKPSILSDAYEAVIGAVFLDGGFSNVNLVLWRLLGEMITRAVEGYLDQDYKGQLPAISQGQWQQVPRYEVVDELGPDHDKTFVVAVFVGDEEVGRAEGQAKKLAEQRAAQKALEGLA